MERAWLIVLVVFVSGLAAYAALVLLLVLTGRRTGARALAGFVPDCVLFSKRLLADPRLPRRQKLLLWGLIVYLASPLDLVPDFIPVAGQLDDALLVGLVLRRVLGSCPQPALVEHWPGPEVSLELVLRVAGRHPGRATAR